MAKRAQPDPIVEEIRDIRARLWKQGGGTSRGYLDLIRSLSTKKKPNKAKVQSLRKGKSRDATA